MGREERIAIVRAALGACAVPVEHAAVIAKASTEKLDGYVLGYETAARLIAEHLGIDLAEAGLGD